MSRQKSKELKQESGRKKSLHLTLQQITKEFGKGSIMSLGSKPRHVPVISSGSLAVDNALGVGGYPLGRIIEIYGPESAGKTTLALEAAAQCQKQNGIVAYIDTENALDPDYAQALGVNIDDLLLSQPDTGEQAMQICELLAKCGAVDLIVVDSVAALVPRQEIEGEMGDNHVGLQARLMSQSLRSLSGTLSRSHTTCIFTNQLREKVGIMFGNPETTPGGRALKFYSTIRLQIRRGPKLKKGTDIIGMHSKIKISKNKVAPPFKKTGIDIMFGNPEDPKSEAGISLAGEVLDMGSNSKLLHHYGYTKPIIGKAGSWYSYKGKRIGQGKARAKSYLYAHPKMLAQAISDIRNMCHLEKAEPLYVHPLSSTEVAQKIAKATSK